MNWFSFTADKDWYIATVIDRDFTAVLEIDLDDPDYT